MGPVLTGDAPIGALSRPPAFLPEKPMQMMAYTRRWPAAIVCLSTSAGNPPMVDEETAWRLTAQWSPPQVKRIFHRTPPKGDAERGFFEFVTGHKPLIQWWRRSHSWRVPRTFRGWRQVEFELEAPRLTTWEVARLRLTDDISTDFDVVNLVAYCQGVNPQTLSQAHGLDDPWESMASGLRKLQSSPWFIFTLSAPFMQPTGVHFPGVPFTDACMRMAQLIKNPHQANDEEIMHIVRSPSLKSAYREAIHLRRGDKYAMRAGPWFALGKVNPLGPHFKPAQRLTTR